MANKKPIDYRSFSSDGKPPQPGPIKDKRWWLLPEDDRAAAVTSVCQYLATHQGARQTQNVISARLYGNRSVMGVMGMSYSRTATVQAALRDKISYNVAQSCVDTVTSKIAKNKPRPLFLTSGGDYKIQRRAKKLTKFTDGIFYENQAYVMGKEAFRDGAIWGTGIIHVFDLYGRVKWERVLPDEILVDEIEGFYGKPRQMHRIKTIDRLVLMDMFPSKKRIIRECNAAKLDDNSADSSGNISDVVEVRESWHLRSGPDANDGMHILTLENGELHKEEYTRDTFPFAYFHWSKRLFGFWGQGGVEQIQNIQVEINKLLWVIQRSMHLMGSFKIAVENSSKVNKAYFNNEIGTVIPYTDKPPVYLTPSIVPAEVYAHLQTLKNAAYEQFGISQLSASAKKPEGLDSGKALREYNDIESDRFMIVGQAYEQFFLDLASLSIQTAKEIDEKMEKGSFTVQVPDKNFVQSIRWDEIDLEEDQYVMKCYPTSSLPQDPSGRLQTVQEYVQAGFFSQRTAQRLLDFPDLEQIESLQTAQENYLHEVFERIVEADDEEEANELYRAPEPYDDLQLAQELGLEYYAQGKCNGLEEWKLDLIRQFLDQITVLVTKAAAPPPGAPQVPPGPGNAADAGGMPTGVPAPQPVSDLLPVAA